MLPLKSEIGASSQNVLKRGVHRLAKRATANRWLFYAGNLNRFDDDANKLLTVLSI